MFHCHCYYFTSCILHNITPTTSFQPAPVNEEHQYLKINDYEHIDNDVELDIEDMNVKLSKFRIDSDYMSFQWKVH
jgi:hypothetical protein